MALMISGQDTGPIFSIPSPPAGPVPARITFSDEARRFLDDFLRHETSERQTDQIDVP